MYRRHRRLWPFCRDCRRNRDPETLAEADLPDCTREQAQTMPLCMVLPGEEVELVTIQGCPRVRRRLADLGLNIGMQVRVVRTNGGGPMILAVKDDSRLGIGRGLANKIIVKLNSTKR